MGGATAKRLRKKLQLPKVRISRLSRISRLLRRRVISQTSNRTRPPWWESKTGEMRNWLDLPQDITLLILSKVGVVDILRNTQMVCSTWRDLCKGPYLFTRIILPKASPYFRCCNRFEDFIRKLVDKSCGQMTEFCLMEFLSRKILDFVTLQGHSIKYLKVNGMSFGYLYAFAKRIPQLEHLDLCGAWPGRTLVYTIQELGCSCPNLKHLRLHFSYEYERDLKNPHFCIDHVAFAIAEYMPRLESVRVFNNTLGNKGLQAILQGCPELEYIGLQRCPFINIHDRDWLRDCSVLRNKIIDARVHNKAEGNFECFFGPRICGTLQDQDEDGS